MAWRKVDTFDNVTQAGLIKSLLEQHNIPAQIKNFYASGVLGDLPFVDHFPEIWVDEAHFFMAQKVIEQHYSPQIEGSNWLCSACQEPNPSNFEVCWQCQEEK